MSCIISILELSANTGFCSETDSKCYQVCDNVDPAVCMLPFPSSFFLKEDATTKTGYRVNFSPLTLPTTRTGRLDPAPWNEKDGFSTIGPLLFYFKDVSTQGTVNQTSIGDSLFEDCKTIVLDTDTGQRVPHWVEKDAVEKVHPEDDVMIIQPAIPLHHARRYIVAVRGLLDTSGNLIQPSDYFKKILQAENTENDKRWEYYHEKIFPILKQNNVEVETLQIAWDFVTVSRESSLGRFETMRDDALRRFSESEPVYEVSKIEESNCNSEETTIGRTIWGWLSVPSYLENGRGTRLTNPITYKTSMNIQFVVRIPCSVMKDPSASFVLEYGHGLFGDRSEVQTGYLDHMANEYKWILFASDWYGMSKFDVLNVAKYLLSDLDSWAVVPEMTMQGFINRILLLKFITGKFAEDDSVKVNNIPTIDGSKFGYYGNSQGGILGGALMAASPDHKRGVLGVAGTPFALLLSRSVDFAFYHALLNLNLYTWRHIRLAISLLQMLWDAGESAGWLNVLADSDKQILMHVAIADGEVTPLGAHIMARTYKCSTVKPQTRPIYGVTEREAPFNGSAIVEWKYTDVPDAPATDTPPTGFNTHECPRRETVAQLQIREFLESGMIQQFCEGPCIQPHCGFEPKSKW